MNESLIRNLCVKEPEFFQFGEPLQIFQPGVRNFGPREIKRFQIDQFYNILETRIRDVFGPTNAKKRQILEIHQMPQSCITDLRVPEIKMGQRADLANMRQCPIRETVYFIENSLFQRGEGGEIPEFASARWPVSFSPFS